MIQKRMKSILIAGMMLVSISFIFMPSANAYIPVSITGFIYVDGNITDPDQATLIFTGGSFIAELKILGVSGTYRIQDDFQDHLGETGYFDVIILGTSYTADETVTVTEAGVIGLDLHVTTGGPPPTNDPPNTPSNPNPADLDTDVVKNIIVSWTCTDPDGDPLTYDVYFGTNSNPSIQSTDQTGNTFDPGILNDDTDYYWKIVAKDDHAHSTGGPIWQFTTGTQTNNPPNIPFDPDPENNTNNVDRKKDLGWSCNDPDGDQLIYDVYFGQSSNPPKASTGQSSSSFNTGTMSYSKRYYWKIVAKDNKGGISTSPIWTFRTEKAPNGNGGGGNGGNPATDPVADANGPYFEFLVDGQASVTFDGTGSTGTIDIYFWEFEDFGNVTGEKSTFTFTELGNFTVKLTTTGPTGSDSDETYVVISEEPNLPPETPIVTGPHKGSKNIKYSFTANSTDPDGDDIYYMFDWDDETTTTSDTVENATKVTVNKTWSTWGIYEISVTASDNKTVSDAKEHVILVDVIWVKTIGYLIDINSDGTYEKFNSNETETQNDPEELENGSYLINSDSDKDYDWIYDPETDTLWAYTPPTEEQDYTLWYALIIILILLVLIIAALAMRKKQKDKAKKQQPKQKKK